MGNNTTKLKIRKAKLLFCFFILIFLFYPFHLNLVRAYFLDDPSKSIESVFNKNPFQFSPINLDKFIKTDRSGLSFSDLVNTKSFSSQDIGSSLKAVAILFIRLIITTLNVALGIFKVLLGVLTKVL